MKIITNDSAYVQKNDISYLNSSDLPIPASIFMKVFGNGVTIINDSNRYDFVKFDEESEIEYFKDLDWMIDYNQVKDLSEDEMIKLAESIGEERDGIANSFNSMSEEERKFLEIVDLKKGFGSGDTRQEVLRGMNFTVAKGDYVTIDGDYVRPVCNVFVLKKLI